MTRFRNLLKFSVAVAGMLLAGTAAKADTLTFTLNTPYQSGPSNLFTFTGTIAYTSTDSLNDVGVTEYLNGDDFSISAPATLDDSSFLLNSPLSMNPGDSWSGVIFTVTTPPFIGGSLAANFYTGSFSIVGGNSPSDTTDLLATAPFDVQVTPEPTSLLLLASGLAGLLTAKKLRKA